MNIESHFSQSISSALGGPFLLDAPIYIYCNGVNSTYGALNPEAELPMNGTAKYSARALVPANLRRLSASLPRAVARRRLLSATAVLTGVTTRDFVATLFLSLSLSALPDCSAMRKYLVLTPAEAGGIRYSGPPSREKVWVGARNDKRTSNTKNNRVSCPSGYYYKRICNVSK